MSEKQHIQTVGDLRRAIEYMADETPVTAFCAGDPSVGIWDAVYGVSSCTIKYDGDDGWCELGLTE